MARNKYPQETIHKILDVAQELFLTKGYEHTSIQDIIDGLGGLTKGAIYHHFKSKEEILSAVLDRLYAGKGDRMAQILADREMTGRENPFYEYYDQVLEILREFDVTISLGDALRCLHRMIGRQRQGSRGKGKKR